MQLSSRPSQPKHSLSHGIQRCLTGSGKERSKQNEAQLRVPFPVSLRNIPCGQEVQFSEFPKQVLQLMLHFPQALEFPDVSKKYPLLVLQVGTQSLNLPGLVHITPASSVWSQFSLPHPRKGQLIIEVSLPVKKKEMHVQGYACPLRAQYHTW